MVTRSVDWETGLVSLTVASAAEVDAVLTAAVNEAVSRLFAGGWQPVELQRAVARNGDPLHGRLVADAVAAYLRGFPRARIDPRWLAQADELGAQVWWGADDTYLSEAASRWKVDRVALLDAVAGLLQVLAALPPIEILMPPPGTVPKGGFSGNESRRGRGQTQTRSQTSGKAQSRGAGQSRDKARADGEARASDETRASNGARAGGKAQAGGGTRAGREAGANDGGGASRGARDAGGDGRVDERLLDRVRALLAKAESTDFPAEAEAYSAKAQELIARHSIDEALAAGTAAEVVPFARRVGVDHPYENEKAALLDAVARANHCQTVWSPELAFTTVFGFDSDIDAVELLHTSLLVQANRAMAQAEPAGGKAGKARLKAFRRSFLIAYAVRIGERLEEAAATALAEAEAAARLDSGNALTGPSDSSAGRGIAGGSDAASDLLPMLASRDAQVRETMHRVFPNTVRARGSRVDSIEGWDSGRAAADRAALTGPR